MIHISTPSIIMKFHATEGGQKERKPYKGAMHWQLVELDDGEILAIGACFHARAIDKENLIQLLRILYHDYHVNLVRMLRPKGKKVPRGKKIKRGTFKNFYELRLPEDVLEVL